MSSASSSKAVRILRYSNPRTVFALARKKLGKTVQIELSSRADKKYQVFDRKRNRWVHFGQWGYEDYTKHKDEERRRRFRMRNHAWASAERYSPAYLSYVLLW